MIKKDLSVSIKLLGLGGQGVVTAASILARAAFKDGYWSQAMPFFGVERTGTPVEAYVRIGQKPIRNRQKLDQPDILLINEAKLLTSKEISQQLTIVNQPKDSQIKKSQIIYYDSRSISLTKLGKDLAIGLLGGLAASWPQISRQAWLEALTEHFNDEVLAKVNIEVFQDNFDLVDKIIKH